MTALALRFDAEVLSALRAEFRAMRLAVTGRAYQYVRGTHIDLGAMCANVLSHGGTGVKASIRVSPSPVLGAKSRERSLQQ